MSESDDFTNEFEGDVSDAVFRYYDYINDAEGGAATILIAITEFLSHLPASIDLSVEELFSGQSYEAMYERNMRALNEYLVLLPLLYVGPKLELSTCSSEELHIWHDSVIKMVLNRTKQDHDAGCLNSEEGNSQHMSCDDSIICPQRFLDRYLLTDAWTPDFTTQQYQDNPARTRAIVVDKLALGDKYGIILPNFHDTTLQEYEAEYDAYIDDLVRQASVKIDYFKQS